MKKSTIVLVAGVGLALAFGVATWLYRGVEADRISITEAGFGARRKVPSMPQDTPGKGIGSIRSYASCSSSSMAGSCPVLEGARHGATRTGSHHPMISERDGWGARG